MRSLPARPPARTSIHLDRPRRTQTGVVGLDYVRQWQPRKAPEISMTAKRNEVAGDSATSNCI